MNNRLGPPKDGMGSSVPEREFPSPSENLYQQLAEIIPSGGPYEPKYYPCKVTFRDGSHLDHVYLVQADEYFRTWGVWPDEDKGKFEVRIEDVAMVADSPNRLPVRFANELYIAGESGMGGTFFSVQFRDGSSAAYTAGNAIDFIDYPGELTGKDIVGVTPHEGRNERPRSCPKYYWCLFR